MSMIFPTSLSETIAKLTDSTITQQTPLRGGDINQAAQVVLADGRVCVVKWRQPSMPLMFAAEARGLSLLRATETLRIPQVIAHAEATGDCPAFILLEWLESGRSSPETARQLGRGLAALHRQPPQLDLRRLSVSKSVSTGSVSTGSTNVTGYGLDHDNFIGANPQPNQPRDNWVDFFREERLGYQMELARRQGYLTRERGALLERLLSRLGDYLPANPPSSLLHGDLWGGNWLTMPDGQPALIDPAVYYGDREAEIAFTELFGGFSAAFYEAYNEAWSLDSGYAQRRDLYNLYHLLNHLNLFGEGYGRQVDRVLRAYA